MVRGRFKFNIAYVYCATLFISTCAPWEVKEESCVTPDGGAGNCVTVRACKSILTFMQEAPKPLSQQHVKLLGKYRCEDEGQDPKVCCPPEPLSFDRDVADSPKVRNNNICDCVDVRDCGPILSFMEQAAKPLSQQDIKVLEKYACGYEGTRPKVCCPSGPITSAKKPSKINGSSSMSRLPPDVSRHRNVNLLPSECGYLDIDDKITYGTDAGLSQFPWMALLSYRTGKGAQFKCGGSILNDRYILTAAHCIKNTTYALIGVRVGEHDIQSKIDCEENEFGEKVCAPPVQDLFVEEIIPHPKYSRSSLYHDIGLLRVAPMNLTVENARPVCLPLDNMRTYDFKNRHVVVTGWGATETGHASPILQRGDVPAISNKECNRLYQKVKTISFRQLCALSKNGTDSCAGDSGGPLHVAGLFKGEVRFVQQGIVSFGPRNCSDYPGVYTRVAHYMDWILDNIRE